MWKQLKSSSAGCLNDAVQTHGQPVSAAFGSKQCHECGLHEVRSNSVTLNMKVISLGSVTFDNLVELEVDWSDYYRWQPIGQTIRYNLAGGVYVTENSRGGRKITLTCKEDGAWLTLATVKELHDLASIAGVTHILNTQNDQLQTVTYTVMFARNSSPLDLTPVDAGKNYYIGTINLIEV